ncbi:asparaginase, partial [Candidatus Falkowbacteria bacterium]|nr:asparaginase [Candidatus Falkowbacteria bacterium]
ASAALSFIVEQSPVPIIFVGAQRSSDRGSSDAAMNLICAAEFAVKSDFGGVAICMHESASDNNCFILPGTKTYKLHSSRRDAFKAINDSPFAKIDYKTREIKYLLNNYSKRVGKLVLKPKMEDKVGLLKIHLNMFPEQFSFFKGYKGLIIEGTGLGHTPGQVPNKESAIHKKIYPAIKELVDSGCVVVMATQCLFGGVNMNVYDKGRDLLGLGVIPGKDMLANTALVKLSWLLGNYSHEEAKKLITQNLRGEINGRLVYEEDFLREASR